jgi:hypothetical protein
MSNYQVESPNVQFMNMQFLDKIDKGMEKEASIAASLFVRQKLREDGFARKILPPQAITAAELDRQVSSEEPIVICETEPDSVAATLPLLGRSEIRYWKAGRYAVNFQKVTSADFRKSKWELMTYRTDIRTLLQENSIKDLQEQEDIGFYNNIVAMATANSNVHSVGAFSASAFTNALGYMAARKLPVGAVLMSQQLYLTALSQPATTVGSPLASELYAGRGSLESLYGTKVITTNKVDLLGATRMIIFTTPQYLGQFYELQAPTVFVKAEQDILQFQTYEALGIGIGNVNGAIVIDFV